MRTLEVLARRARRRPSGARGRRSTRNGDPRFRPVSGAQVTLRLRDARVRDPARSRPRPAFPGRRQRATNGRPVGSSPRDAATSCSRWVPGSARARRGSPAGSPSSTPSRSTGASSRALTATLAGRRERPRPSGPTPPVLDPAEARPAARVIVANLPYGVATPVISGRSHGRALLRDGSARDRRAALREPGTKAYGAVSVLVQLGASGRPPGRVAQGVRAPAQRRLGARRVPPPAGGRIRARSGSGRPGSSTEPSPTAERRSQTRCAWPGCRRRRPRSPGCGRSSSRPSGWAPGPGAQP